MDDLEKLIQCGLKVKNKELQRRLGHRSDLVLKQYIKLSREDMIAAAVRFHNQKYRAK